jgi:glycerophosphoryl diester phosphodiesterase
MDEPAQGVRRPILLGHRGCRGAHAENTLIAFEHALESGCDGFEFDVRRTSDGVGIICHNPSLFRRQIARSRYEEFELAAEKRSRTRLLRKNTRKICCLEEVLDRFAGRAFLNIELKVTGLEEHTVQLWRRHPRILGAISSFIPEVVLRVKELAPEIPVGFIFDSSAGLKRWRRLPTTHVMPHFSFVSAGLIADMHNEERQVISWTVNNPRIMRKFAEWGIDGLISDDPVRLSDSFGGKP